MNDAQKAMRLMQDCVVAAARTREIIRNEFPDCAQLAYGAAQHDPVAIPDYVKEVFKEAKKRGLIAPDSPAPSQEE